MRIACVSTSKVPGITANALQLMKATQALLLLGHEVQLWLPGYGEDLPEDDLQHMYGLRTRVPLRRLGYLKGLKRYDFCLRAVLAARGWGADLLYVWPLQAAAFGASSGLPTVLEMHDLPSGKLGPALFRRYLAAPGAARLLVTTGALQKRLEREFGAVRVRELAVPAPNGVDFELYRELPAPAQAREKLGLPERFTAAYTGHLYPGRGAELMFELARQLPGIAFLWAGGTPEAVERWRRRAESEAVTNLELLGFVPNRRLPLVQAAGDLLLMPYQQRIEVSGGGDSSQVASPMKAFEYMAAGRPILSSDLPVLREVLSEEHAVLLPPDDLSSWRAAIEGLRGDEDRRRALGRRARAAVEGHSWQARAARALEGLEA